jgi:hypothetical protein
MGYAATGLTTSQVKSGEKNAHAGDLNTVYRKEENSMVHFSRLGGPILSVALQHPGADDPDGHPQVRARLPSAHDLRMRDANTYKAHGQ